MKRIKKQWGIFVSTIFLILSGVLLSTSSAMAYSWSFDVVSPDLSGAPGETLIWEYTIRNYELDVWLNLYQIDSSDWEYGIPDASYFDYPFVAPGETVSSLISDDIFLFSFTWDNDAPIGSFNVGEFSLTGEWYDSDNILLLSNDTKFAEYSATVVPSSNNVIPEPSTLLLLCSGLLGLVGVRRKSGKFLR